jgi:hypothetical protein
MPPSSYFHSHPSLTGRSLLPTKTKVAVRNILSSVTTTLRPTGHTKSIGMILSFR